ncbi:PilW family protein [Polynucleobacter sp. AP-Kolm-20A-A1]|uniref:PilW family protein n=1 Tax=Polynucleobacter sp. AP-Kolm-20A-A1 TaxID=2081041 RepID=UPI001BFE39D9|nr:prepilin-type N-terminal cleavage/methylation domain-containing protein [Polynucleobacter sp. AP-Kolm-20A-A1]QWE21457.1 prepilin-type N-terminal cleavage/methylation domain-containing protein [Polynucleobacter sp. AP-Kolm-20A-A1]
MSLNSRGYTLVELLVAIAVTSVVLTGTYAAYTIFSHQQQVLLGRTEVDRSALRAIDLIQADIRMAGFKDYTDTNALPSDQAIQLISATPGDLLLVYDDRDASNNLYRALVRYYLADAPSAIPHKRLMREWRICPPPSNPCDLSHSQPVTGSSVGEPLLDWVSQFTVIPLNLKTTGTTFVGIPQSIQINLEVTSSKKLDGATFPLKKNFTFLARARNVSLVP